MLFNKQVCQHGKGRRRQHSITIDEDEPVTNRQRVEEPDNFMKILKEKSGENKSRNTRHIDFTLCFAPNRKTTIDPRKQLEDAFTKLYERAFGEMEQPKGILIQVYPPNWIEEFTIPLRPPIQNSPNVVAEALIRVNEEYGGGLDLFDGASEVRIIAVWPLDRNNGYTL